MGEGCSGSFDILAGSSVHDDNGYATSGRASTENGRPVVAENGRRDPRERDRGRCLLPLSETRLVTCTAGIESIFDGWDEEVDDEASWG